MDRFIVFSLQYSHCFKEHELSERSWKCLCNNRISCISEEPFSSLGIQRRMALSNTAQIIRDSKTAGSCEFATWDSYSGKRLSWHKVSLLDVNEQDAVINPEWERNHSKISYFHVSFFIQITIYNIHFSNNVISKRKDKQSVFQCLSFLSVIFVVTLH